MTYMYLESYGCTSNEEFIRKLEAYLEKKDVYIVKDSSKSDTIVLNTCCVIEATENAMLKKIKQYEGKRLIVTGCLAKVSPDKIKKVNNDAIILDQHYFYELFRECDDIVAKDGKIGIVNIGKGCVGECSYCITKVARGSLVSKPPDDIVKEVKELVDKGVIEVRLTGQDVGAYGRDISYGLPDLLRDIVSIDKRFYIRVGMINPHSLKDKKTLYELIEVFKNEKIFKFLHLPVQSGSDRVLKDMNRRYSVDDFLNIVRSFRSEFDSILTLSTDFIVGYPSETEEDFKKSVELLHRCMPNKVNITRYSPRPFTQCEDKDILGRIKKARSRIMTEETKKIYSKINKSWIGRIVRGIATERGKKGGVIVRDISYHQIVVKDDLAIGTESDIKIDQDRNTYFVGYRVIR
ncbi:tRNA (N(6)-L-threonylcarbamoyladenosine(37)-C(2))-methylthiotransferase [Candidatus Methanoliparum sp. LAM-1]|uniref:tRNA (N(6)-L-threonylcarbamoyladenosine(37)-C(2))- methylthiotransferase n=1 Tax=Candidatus Methanoliparum sp. LAM-1 TaxID=2874846 RepID=UPI001E4E0FF3|nr:tRNA (N(6)-L-threonylcarbamoyladenosine(37)-C(2))-methylthiotransferase [Candidatus Methanoliparum sp. LAM-1]BDC36104.1 threonylcarbamoyladenosine tRNA methylthiotransferase [Candidatus Methanoliparum sp. LAM-1]